MDTLLLAALGVLLSAGAVYLLLLLTRIFPGARTSELTIQDVKLSPLRWAVVLLLFGGILGATYLGYREFERWAERALVPPTDPTRFSFLVADFQGPGGREVSDAIAQELQRSLGTGVQVLRVPFQMSEETYGDAASKRLPNQGRSILCARDYSGDVVLWGSFNSDTGLVQISITASTRPCADHCGIMSAHVARSLPISELSTHDSETRSELLSSLASAAQMPLRANGLIAQAQGCAGSAPIASIYIQKIERFLANSPVSIPPHHMADVFMALGFYQTRLAEHSGNAELARTAAANIRRVRELAPAEWPGMAGVYSDALAPEAGLSRNERRSREIAQELSTLRPPADTPGLAAWTMEATARVWTGIFDHTRNPDDFARAAQLYEQALAVPVGDPEWTFALQNALARFWIKRLEDSGDSAAYRSARRYIVSAEAYYSALTPTARGALDPTQRYMFFAAQLGLSRFGNASLILSRIERVQEDGLLEPENWTSDAYVELKAAYGSAFLAAYLRTGDATYAFESIWTNTGVIANVPAGSEQAAKAYHDIGSAYVSLYNRGGGDVARSGAQRSFLQAKRIYERFGDLRNARAADGNISALLEHRRIPNNEGLINQIDALRLQLTRAQTGSKPGLNSIGL